MRGAGRRPIPTATPDRAGVPGAQPVPPPQHLKDGTPPVGKLAPGKRGQANAGVDRRVDLGVRMRRPSGHYLPVQGREREGLDPECTVRSRPCERSEDVPRAGIQRVRGAAAAATASSAGGRAAQGRVDGRLAGPWMVRSHLKPAAGCRVRTGESQPGPRPAQRRDVPELRSPARPGRKRAPRVPLGHRQARLRGTFSSLGANAAAPLVRHGVERWQGFQPEVLLIA